MSEELIGTAEAAQRMGRSKKWVEYLIREKRLPAILVGKSYVIKASDVDSFEHKPRGKPPAHPAQPKEIKARTSKKASNGKR
jgi:excisionase family DNA binding protein